MAPEAIVNTSLMPHRRSFTARELEAAELWRDVLKEGGANVGLTDHVDQVRYAKVSLVLPSDHLRGGNRWMRGSFSLGEERQAISEWSVKRIVPSHMTLGESLGAEWATVRDSGRREISSHWRHE